MALNCLLHCINKGFTSNKITLPTFNIFSILAMFPPHLTSRATQEIDDEGFACLSDDMSELQNRVNF